MKHLIINADDFGINKIVTREIEKLIESRTISSTTIMANGECLNEVKRFVPMHPEASFGVHLCLSEFSSLTKSKILHQYGLTDENGAFKHKAIFRIKHFNSQLLDAITEELSAQIEEVKNLGVPISHADSHHHVHTIYPLRDVFTRVLKDYGITKLRLCSEFRTFREKAHLLQWIRRIQLNKYFREHFKTTNNFYSYAAFISIGSLAKNNEVVELMCHPGHPGNKYQAEMDLVKNKVIQKQMSIKLISYNDIY